MVISLLPNVSSNQAINMAKVYGCKYWIKGRQRFLVTRDEQRQAPRPAARKPRSVLAGATPWPQLSTPSNDGPEPPSAA